MKIELFLDEDVHSGLAHALRKPVCKKPKRTLGGHCFKTTSVQRNDVKIVAPASVYRKRNDEEQFRVFVNFISSDFSDDLFDERLNLRQMAASVDDRI
jgi:hypothetical protein